MIRLSSMTSISDNLNSIPNTIAPIVQIPNSVSMHSLMTESHHKPPSNVFFKVPDHFQKIYSVSCGKVHDVQSMIMMVGSDVPVFPYFFFLMASLALSQAEHDSV
jgi:hypothetical protein